MKLGAFEAHRPTTVAAALDIRTQVGDDGAFYAGGTELLLVMKLGLADFDHLIDLKRIEALSELRVTTTEIRVGASVPYQRIIRHPAIQEVFPDLLSMLAEIGNLRVRSTGTLGGNLAFADPHSDPLTFLIAAGAWLEIAGPDGSVSTLDLKDLTLAPYLTSLHASALITSVVIPIPEVGRRFVHHHIRFRERPALTVTAAGSVVGSAISSPTLVIGAVVGIPNRIMEAEQLLADGGSAAFPEVQKIVSQVIDPTDDLDGSADYKRHLAGVYAVRALQSLVRGR